MIKPAGTTSTIQVSLFSLYFHQGGVLDDVCDHLADAVHDEADNAVQAQVNLYKLYANYMDDLPQILISLYLGPLSGSIKNNE